MKYKYILEIELDEENNELCTEYDKEHGEGECMKQFIENLEMNIDFMLPNGMYVSITKA
jgi:hypothetical protein